MSAIGFAPATQPAPKPSLTGQNPVQKREYEIAALRSDGSLMIGQTTAAALPIFDAAFSALAHGSLVLTPQGHVAIEDLQPGDHVSTGPDTSEPAIWIGSARFAPRQARDRTRLTRITGDAFGANRPLKSLTLGHGARVLQTVQNGASQTRELVPANTLVDGVNVISVTPPTSVRLYHICLAHHAAITVNGIEIETFHPGELAETALSSSLRDRFLSLFPRVAQPDDFGPMAFPRQAD